MVRISEKDIRIIKILFENSRKPFTQIAKILGISEAAVRKRVKKLSKKGIIKKFTVDINWKRLEYNCHVMVGIDTKPESLLKTIDLLKNRKEILRIYTCSGDHMIIFEAIFKSFDDFIRFEKWLKKDKGILRICPAIILEDLWTSKELLPL